MDLTASWVASYGLAGLALMAFLAATLLPLSSEVAVLAALHLGCAPEAVFLWASVGNSAGALSNYLLGRCLTGAALTRLHATRWGPTAVAWAQRYGGWSLAGSCLPLIGDPLMLLSGILRLPYGYVVGLGLGTRVLRYGVLIALTVLAEGELAR